MSDMRVWSVASSQARSDSRSDAFISPLHRLPFDEAAAAQTARIRWHLERRGMLTGPCDLRLAGQALALDLTLVTHNLREFGRVRV
jgi:tRNA(fMet)-specific endonuclease VapC